MRNIHCIINVISDLFAHLVDQPGQRGFTSACLADVNQMSGIIHVQERFNAQRHADNCRNLGNPSAAMQMEQVIDGKVVAEFQPVTGNDIGQLRKGLPLFFQLDCIGQHQSLSH